jgi:prophage regulatory protein
MRLPEVRERVGLSSTMIYRLVGLGRFPKQVKISERASRWIESEVEAFMVERAAARDHQSALPAPAYSPYMRMAEVMKRTALDSSTIYTLVREGTFPKWAKLPKIASGWMKSDVEAWLVSHAGSSAEGVEREKSAG